jgi:uncharacterized OB-fold protein
MSQHGEGAARFEPPVSRVSTPFWDATRERRLVLQYCRECESAIWFPRVLCPGCGNDGLEWRDVAGDGAVYAVSVQHRAAHPGLANRVPYAVALVDLDAGVRMLSNVIGCAADRVSVGMRVRPAWEALSDGRHLLMFEPVGLEEEP